MNKSPSLDNKYWKLPSMTQYFGSPIKCLYLEGEFWGWYSIFITSQNNLWRYLSDKNVQKDIGKKLSTSPWLNEVWVPLICHIFRWPTLLRQNNLFSFSSLWKQPCNGLLLAIPFKKRFRLNLGFWFNKKLCNPSTLSVFSKNIMNWWARGDCVFVFLVSVANFTVKLPEIPKDGAKLSF